MRPLAAAVGAAIALSGCGGRAVATLPSDAGTADDLERVEAASMVDGCLVPGNYGVCAICPNNVMVCGSGVPGCAEPPVGDCVTCGGHVICGH